MADTPRLRALQNLSNNLPVANSQVAAGQAAARDMQIQNAVKAAPSGGATTATAQQTGTTAAQQAGQQMVQGAGQQLEQQNKIAQVGAAETANTNQQQVASLQAGAKDQAMDNLQKLDKVSSGAKTELYDKQMQFAKDSNQRTIFSENQLADYARANAQSDQEYQNKAQAAQLMSKRYIQVLETAHAKIIEDLNFKYQQARQAGDHEATRQVTEMLNQTNDRIAREKARAANSAAAWQAGGTIVGAVGGTILGGPAGAAGGAAVGGAIGSMVGGM